ncbi:PilZ domain-containing protein [Propionivibrio sp.]|uniref:PilZ domain-containing protein n=1 Tax=Propionivibrio sp. TaxID=2212460 RepID=UPI0039E30F31
MLKSLFGKSHGASSDAAHAAHGRERVDLGRIRTLIEFFPIGKKLRYYPEFNKDIVLDTLVVAYCANGHFVYAMESIETDRDGLPTVFRGDEDKVRLPATGLRTFQMLVPDTSDLEMKLDYLRRAQISRNGQFSAGNNISLISNAGVKGVSTVNTEVAKQVVLRDGPYAQMNMVLLTPDLNTLAVTDQRRKPRTRINVPVTALLPAENYTGECTLVDISDAEVRIRLGERGAVPAIHEGDAMIVDIRLGEAERRYSVKGSVVRRSAETCVLGLDGQIREGRLVPFAPLDLLELKAGLLNYGR